MQAIKKGRVGKFEFWLAGKMRWEVRRDGAVLAIRQTMSDCVRACERLDHQEKHPDLYDAAITEFYGDRQASGLGACNGMTR